LNFFGVIIGAASFMLVGIFHPVVIKTEYHFGIKPWPLFLIAGLAAIAGSLFCPNDILAAVLAVLGFTLLWSIHELFAQKTRVEKGWFPGNPNKEAKKSDTLE
jgi:hypothetical protein